MKNKAGGKILLFMHSLHGYAEEAVKNLQERGFDVTHYQHSSRVPKKELGGKDRIIRWLSRKTGLPKVQAIYFDVEKKYYTPQVLDSLSE